MRIATVGKFVGIFALARVIVGLLFALFQRATAEGDFIVFLDVPTIGLEFLSAKIFGCPSTSATRTI